MEVAPCACLCVCQSLRLVGRVAVERAPPVLSRVTAPPPQARLP